MAALTAITPTNTGAVSAGAAVASSDTVSTFTMGRRGALLEIINGNASPDNVTISDVGLTPSGNPLSGGTISSTVTNGTSRIFRLRPEQAESNFGVITITHSVTATVTYKLYPID